jgi:uncharacterized protein (TIGR01777 family)
MKLAVTGATGFIGTRLCARLLEQGHTLTLFTRGSPRDRGGATKRWVHWTPGMLREWGTAVDGVDGVINLAGEPIAAKKWTHLQRHRIESSRVDGTNGLVQAIAKARVRPKFLISASAVGYYGPRGDETVTEETPPGNDFLGFVCRQWEEEAKKAEELGVRVARLRTGIVLGSGGGALAKMAEPFKFFVGGALGSGQQWMSWIQLEDHVRLILELIDNTHMSGPVNATAPNPVRNKEFCQTLAKVLHRPCWAPVPGFALKLLLGDMADMLLTGQKVMPAAAQRFGYRFRYPTLEEALQASIHS